MYHNRKSSNKKPFGDGLVLKEMFTFEQENFTTTSSSLDVTEYKQDVTHLPQISNTLSK